MPLLPFAVVFQLSLSAPAAAAPANREPASASAEDADDGEKASEELEEMRALEDAAIEPPAGGARGALPSYGRLGVGNPLRARLDDDADSEGLEAFAPANLGLITDLSSFDVTAVASEYDIPVEMQPLVAQYIHFFQGSGRKWFRKWMSRSTRYIPMMTPLLEQAGLPRDTVYLAMIESGFSPDAYSWAKAAGPWQFIASTGKRFGLREDFWVDERRDPTKATRAAARYLRELHSTLGHWYLAWAGYNAGGEKLRRLSERRASKDFWALSDGKGLARETKHYVPKLIACALVAKHPRAFGFSDDEFEYQTPPQSEEVEVEDPTDLDVLARAAGVSVEDVKALNPELRRWCTPPATAQHPYLLRLPKGSREAFLANYPRIAPRERLTYRVHRIKRGDTLSHIAASYHSAAEAILALNRLRNARSLRINTDLVVPVALGRGGEEGAAHAGLERQVAHARRAGVVAPRPEEEVPAGTVTPRAPLATGPIKTEVVGGKTRVLYGVQNGDSLWTIAQRFNVSVENLKVWNSVGRKVKGLQIGTQLEVWPGPAAASVEAGTLVAAAPVAAPPAAPASGESRPATHQLAAGETLWSVSQRYGVSVDDLKRWNRIGRAGSVKAGQQLSLAGP